MLRNCPGRQAKIAARLLVMVLTLPFLPGVVTVASAQEDNRMPSQSVSEQAAPVETAGNLLGVLWQGGIMLVPLAVCSFLLVLFALERSISLRRGRVIPGPFVRRFIQQLEDGGLDSREALELCREDGSPVAEVFAAGVMKWDRSAVEVEQAIIDAGERVAQGLRRYLRLFNGISTISPLLGLLGTVVGMIRAFNAIATTDAMGKPELLATGISQALITTAAGLTVAIPAIVIYLYFASKADRLVIEIDRVGQQVVNAIAIDGWKESRKSKTKRSKAA